MVPFPLGPSSKSVVFASLVFLRRAISADIFKPEGKERNGGGHPEALGK